MGKFTPGPWRWMSEYAGPENEFGCATPGIINPVSYKPPYGYSGNPELYGAAELAVISAGGGEYIPYSNPADACLIAAAPDLYAALAFLLDSYMGKVYGMPHCDFYPEVIKARAALAKADGT